jgi:hypothetical protein
MISTPRKKPPSYTAKHAFTVCAHHTPHVRITMQSIHRARDFSRSVSSASDARSMYRTIHHGSSCVPGTFLNRALG